MSLAKDYIENFMVRQPFYLALTVLVLLLNACGGGSSGSSSAPLSNQISPTPAPLASVQPSPTADNSTPEPTATTQATSQPTTTPNPGSSLQPTAAPTAQPTVQPTPIDDNPFPSLIELPEPQALSIVANEDVTLTESTYSVNHWRFSLNADNSLQSVNYLIPDTTSYSSWVMENEYLRVELIPEFGGRIVSIFNKITQHEELYQNPMLSPYLANRNIFYYDWLMIFGGIFPTFPESEHGKSWLLPWDVEVIHTGGDIATLRMSFRDDFARPGAPGQFTYGVTNMICTYTVSLKAGRSAVDVIVSVENPTDTAKNYEYWTNTAPAPGSDPGDTSLTDGYQIIADIESLAPPRAGFGSAYGIYNNRPQTWEEVQFFSTHETDGTAYPNPNIAHSNFWGAINHDVNEGFFRVADNRVTPGLKMFTFGRDNTINADPMGTTNNFSNWQRPAVELWAGVSNQFFFNATMPAESFFHLNETYSPSVGMNNVTHATPEVLINATGSGVELYFMTPDDTYSVRLMDGNNTVFDQLVAPDPLNGNQISHNFTANGNLRILDSNDFEVININF